MRQRYASKVRETYLHEFRLDIPLGIRHDPRQLQEVVQKLWHDAVLPVLQQKTIVIFRGDDEYLFPGIIPDVSYQASVGFDVVDHYIETKLEDGTRVRTDSYTGPYNGVGMASAPGEPEVCPNFWRDPRSMLCKLAEGYPKVQTFTVKAQFIDADPSQYRAEVVEGRNSGRWEPVSRPGSV
jgi:hypothetical protein